MTIYKTIEEILNNATSYLELALSELEELYDVDKGELLLEDTYLLLDMMDEINIPNLYYVHSMLNRLHNLEGIKNLYLED